METDMFFLDLGHYEDKSVPAAVKCIKSVHVDLYENEIKLHRELDHPNVVRYFATKLVDELYFIAMEKGNCNLREFMETNPEDIAILIKLLHDSCLGVQYLHERGIVHRDINPNNILVMKDGDGFTGKLSHFRFSKTLPLLQSEWCSSPRGTFDYTPPEVLTALDKRQDPSYSTSTDIYSLGLTFFYVLSQLKHPGSIRTEKL
jgi:serine/threonine protein kinase